MIYYFTPYSTQKDLALAYNKCMDLLPDDEDYACFTDGDSMFTTHDFGHQLEEITKKYPEVPLFTCMTNRVGTDYQCINKAWDIEEMNKHWKFSKELQSRFRTDCVDITNNSPISGVMILLRKKEWKQVGGFDRNKMLGVDNNIHYKIRSRNHKIYLMKGVYLLHYYRDGKPENKQHLL